MRLGPCGSCSKNDALRLLRKLVVVGVLSEETFRADNQYGGVMSHLSVCEPVARRLADGALHIRMPFLVCQHMPENITPAQVLHCRGMGCASDGHTGKKDNFDC